MAVVRRFRDDLLGKYTTHAKIFRIEVVAEDARKVFVLGDFFVCRAGLGENGLGATVVDW